MPQIELEEQDLEKADKLVSTGVFFDRQQAVKAGLEVLLELSETELKKIKDVQKEVNSYCEIHLGSILYPGIPIRVALNGKDYFKVPIKGRYEDKVYTYGHLLVDAETLAVDEQLSDSPKQIHKTAIELTGGTEDDSPLL